jgi:hypothetical protein
MLGLVYPKERNRRMRVNTFLYDFFREFLRMISATARRTAKLCRLLVAVAFLAFLIWGFFLTDEVECWLHGKAYMEASGAVCSVDGEPWR